MDSVKTKGVAPEKKDDKPMSVEQYQRRWEQLMDDTAKQIQKIRDDEQARKAAQTSR
ncbi:hypothetical protein N7533_013419 [Penicillium manginii]|uniref:uncharacterized protein n=1 Tax=Penicillium manginii TaxID=203109 RepID=UPI00254716BD|nr:uncharacterized protein N7533_013419 [Penicillium manginii]KAJ5732972.1 hypothetical protein N7533_013419 [Penicillium manginii]